MSGTVQSDDQLIGSRPLLDRYQLIRLVGEGAAASVYLAHDLLLENRPVAIKLLHASAGDDARALMRLRREAELAQTITHPNIVQLYSFERANIGEDGRATAFVAMEFVDGPTIRALLTNAPFSPEEALKIFSQLVSGLARAHEAGIVHRDLKPDNILIAADGTVKLTDFGLAKSVEADAVTRTGQVVGTPGYMAPEVYAGNEATPASDVYSLGLVLYELVHGHALQNSERAIQDAADEAEVAKALGHGVVR